MAHIKIIDIQHHRNGVGGEPFFAVLFHDNELDRDMIASVFPEYDSTDEYIVGAEGRVAVYDVEMLAERNIAFGENSWRGDYYENVLVGAIREYQIESRKAYA